MHSGCPVCGGNLTEQGTRCGRCPLSGGCNMICCENCGYETVAPRSATWDLLKRLFRRGVIGDGASRTS